LAMGKTAEELKKEGIHEKTIPHRIMPGNRPSNVLLFPSLGPFQIGQILGIYEHRTVVQGFIWNINSFDQWGVELGKKLADQVREELTKGRKTTGNHKVARFNPSTNALLERYMSKAKL